MGIYTLEHMALLFVFAGLGIFIFAQRSRINALTGLMVACCGWGLLLIVAPPL